MEPHCCAGYQGYRARPHQIRVGVRVGGKGRVRVQARVRGWGRVRGWDRSRVRVTS